jgi:L-rhamnose-H+ transport protein
VGKSNIAKIAPAKSRTMRKIAFDRAEVSDNVQSELIAGAGTVLAAGILQGAFALPMKYARSWNHENIWLVFAMVGLIAAPWGLTLATVPHLGQVYGMTSWGAISAIVGFGLLWGIGATLTGVGLQLLGVGLGLSILIGLSASVGSIIPLLVLTPASLSTHQGHVFLAGSGVMLIGIAVAARAGALRDSAMSRTSPADVSQGSLARNRFVLGLVICICSGIFSSALNLSYAFGAEAIQNARQLGATTTWASNAVAALATSGGFVANLIYCGYQLRKQHSGRFFFLKGTGHNWIFGALMGILWFGGLSLYGLGSLHMGPLGTSLGWPLLMGTIILTSNAGGYIAGEWAGANREIQPYLCGGMAIILLALGILAMAQRP